MITIRPAVPEDAAEIANVHVSSWRETYVGLVPDATIANLASTYRNRYQLWQQITPLKEQVTLVAEHGDDGVVGFVNGGKARDQAHEGRCELYCLYLLQKYQGQQVGYGLLREFFAKSQQRSFNSGYVWVLEGNPALSFYQRTGATPTGDGKTDQCDGAELKEVSLVWDEAAWQEVIAG